MIKSATARLSVYSGLSREPRVPETMEKLSDYFLLGSVKVLLINFLRKTRKTFDGQRIRKFCYCIHSMKSARTRLTTDIHALFMSSLQMGSDSMRALSVPCILCSMNCEFAEPICVTGLSNDTIGNYNTSTIQNKAYLHIQSVSIECVLVLYQYAI